MAAMLSCFSQQRQRLELLADQVQGLATEDNAYFCLCDDFRWAQEAFLATDQALLFDASQREGLQGALGQLDHFRGNILLVSGLVDHPNPQGFLTKLAQIKAKRRSEDHFHWLVLVSVPIAEAFRGLQTFLDGKCYWFDLRVEIADIEKAIDEIWQAVWQQPSTLSPPERQQARESLPDWLGTLTEHETVMGLEPISLLQGKLSLLQGLALESQGEKGRQGAMAFYRESLDIWELLGDEEPLIWLSIRLGYLFLLLATGEKNRGHELWQQTQHHAQTAIAGLADRQWHFFQLDSLDLLGNVLRGIEDWEGMRQAAENSLIFFYQLSPFIATDTSRHPTEDQPWTELELQAQIARAYAYLSEALVEQWKFDEAKEALTRAFETHSPDLDFSHPHPFTPWLHYLSGRILLANDQPKEAAKTLRQAQSLLEFADSPRLYFAILVELRECYLQFQDWLTVVAIDQDYQCREYSMGLRAFPGITPLPCWPHQRIHCHPLTPEKLLGGDEPEPTEAAYPELLSFSWQKLQRTWTQSPTPIVILTGQSGSGRSSWLRAEVMQQLSGQGGILVPFTGDWVSNLWEQFSQTFLPLAGLNQAGLSLEQRLQSLPQLPTAGLWLILDGENGTLPWQQPPSAETLNEGESQLWSWLLPQVQTQTIRLLVSLPAAAIADFQAELQYQMGEDLPPLQIHSLPPLWLHQAETWLANAMISVRHPWSPSLQSQVLGDLAIESERHSEPRLHPLDLQRLGAELENQQITQSVHYQRHKLEQWLWQAIQRQLNFLPPPLLTKTCQLLQALTDDQGNLFLKTDQQLWTELYTPQPNSDQSPTVSDFSAADIDQLLLLLNLLQQSRLITVIYQGTIPYSRLTTPQLAYGIWAGSTATTEANSPPSAARNSSGRLKPKPQLRFTTSQQQTQSLIADLEVEANADEQVAVHKLKAAERQYQRILAGISLERHSSVILKQFESHPLDALLASVQTGQELKQLITPDTLLVDYPSLAPLLTLHNILEQIHERNRFQHRASVTCLQLSPPTDDHLEPLVLTAATNGKGRIWSFQGQLKATLRGHQAPITAVEWSPNGHYIVTASADNTVKLWNRQGEILTTLRGHTDWVRSAHFSPHHEFIITASRDNTVRLWNFAGDQLALCQGHTNWVRNAEFNCNGQILLSASRDGTARIWDLEGREVAILQGHSSWVRNAQFSPNGQLIVTASADGTARIWDLTGQCLVILKGHHNWVRNALWSPDGQMVVTASSDGTARIWSVKGKCLATLQGHHQSIHDARFSPGGEWVVTCSVDGTARLWSRGGHLATILRGHQKDIYHAEFSQDGRFLFTISADHTARQWDISPKKSIVLAGHGHWVRHAHFSPKTDRVLTVSRDKTARLWNLRGEAIAVLEGHQGWVREGQFSPDGQFVVTASADKTVQLWNVMGKRFATLRGHQDVLLSVRFSPDGQYVLSAGKDGSARVWNTRGQELANLRRHNKTVFVAEFSQDGQFIVTASDDHTARIWDIVGRELGICQGHQGPVYDAQFSPDNQWVLTASADYTARVWDFLGQPIMTLSGHQNIVYQAQFSPDSDLIVTASADKTARIWNKDGKMLAVLYGHQGLVSTAQWSPDGQLIVTTSNDGTARIWDRLGRELATLHGHHNWVRSAEFSADCNWVVTASTDGTARLWPVESLNQLIQRGCDWLGDYLVHNPLVKEADRAIANEHPTLGV
ncbi:MAG: eIF2A-related protein [Synechocystis sp.]